MLPKVDDMMDILLRLQHKQKCVKKYHFTSEIACTGASREQLMIDIKALTVTNKNKVIRIM